MAGAVKLPVLIAMLLSVSGFTPRVPADPLVPLRSHYRAAVEDESAIERGLREADAVRARSPRSSGSHLDATLSAYRGALVTLRAKHALWPRAKLRHLRAGLAVLDSTIARHPDHAEARYLRLMSCYYLPGVLGRKWSVREDFAALARLLPHVRHQYPADLYDAVTRFVLERGALPPERRVELRAALEQAGD